MEQHWKELLAIDRYTVKSKSVLHDLDRKIMTLLYQPLIGSKSFSLYMTLWGELEQNRIWSVETTHHSLMTLMQSNLREIYHERIKLEGLGLLKTYLDEIDGVKRYVYELQTPIRPNEFFQDGVLNIYLYNRVGRNKFLQLKRFFSDDQMEEGMKEITKSFDDVFDSVRSAEMMGRVNKETMDDLTLENEREYLQSDSRSKLEISDASFDFDLFFSGLSDALISPKAFTPPIKEVIKKLSYLYGIGAVDMKNVAMSSLDQDDMIDVELLRKSARDWYQFQVGDELPNLVDKKQPLTLRSKLNKKQLSKEEELMVQLETISPRQFLTDVAGGVPPAVGDLQIIEEVMVQQKLEPGVVNVLIYYVMLKTDMKLTRAYVQKIASHWTRKQVKTVKEAMDLAKQEHRQYQQWAEEKTTSKKKSQSKKTPIRKEILPEWLKDDEGNTDKEEQQQNKEGAERKNLEQFELEKKKLFDRIKKYKDNKSGEMNERRNE